MVRLVLASASPRRKELMNRWGVTYRLSPADIDEEAASKALGSTDPSAIALHLAQAKALAVRADADEYMIGVDTLVALGDQILGKPADAAEAFVMLRSEQAASQVVHSGVAIVHQGVVVASAVEHTVVTMRAVSDAEIWQYIRAEKPFDKAGAYAIQEGARGFVDSYEGCYNNIVGMPLCLVRELLLKAGIALQDLPPVPELCLDKRLVCLK